ncbi:MAG TPA: efflux RND transporter periplasmic adaptor subunit [Steroidobacteraceae bacterium]|nr:efflux RND transporter periplasmic adaptor subunit [Steroidobacteraceae bacterium]
MTDNRQTEPVAPHRASSADIPPPRNLRRVGIIAAIVAGVVALSGIGIRWAHDREVRQWTAARAIPAVTVIVPAHGVAGQQTVLPGNIQAWYEAPLYARISGYLKKWYQDFGAHVKKGQLLAEIDAPDVDAELAAAEAVLKSGEAQVKVREAEMEFARTTYDRWRDSPRGVVSEQERESKKADFASASARYNAAIADTRSDQGAVDRLLALEQFKRIVAPFDGVVTARNTDIGALINAGSGAGGGSAPQLFRVADVHEMRVFVQVPQEMSADIHAGQTADLALPQYPDRVFKATVATTAEAISESSRTMLVELHADNPDDLLQPGTFTEVHFELTGNARTVRIPTGALIFREQGVQVAVVDKHDRVKLEPVTLGRNLGTDMEVLAGLGPADRVIDSPSDSLSDGDVVRVVGGTAASSDGERLASKAVPKEDP